MLSVISWCSIPLVFKCYTPGTRPRRDIQHYGKQPVMSHDEHTIISQAKPNQSLFRSNSSQISLVATQTTTQQCTEYLFIRKKNLKSVGMTLAKVKGQDGMTLAKVKEQDGMTLAKVKEQDGMTLAKVRHAQVSHAPH